MLSRIYAIAKNESYRNEAVSLTERALSLIEESGSSAEIARIYLATSDVHGELFLGQLTRQIYAKAH